MTLVYRGVDILPIVQKVIPEVRGDARLLVTDRPTFYYPRSHPGGWVHGEPVESVELKKYFVPRGTKGMYYEFTGALIEIDSDQYVVLMESKIDGMSCVMQATVVYEKR